jgi:alkylation response protein AidB-like acyl-CoA dehydrogenase
MIPRTLFSDEHEIFRATVGRLLDEECVPHHESWEEQGHIDRAAWLKAGEQGLLCPTVPEEYGGLGTDFLYNVVVDEEIARRGLSGIGWGLHSDIVAPYIVNYGSAEMKRRFLPKMISGEMIGAIAMTEPGAGSDLQGVKTTAVRDGDHYVINGSKTFITNGYLADLVIVVAKTDPAGGAKGTSLILVEAGTPGFSKGRKLKKVGMKAQDTSELFFEDVRVPCANLIGEEGMGFVYLMQELPQERLTVGISAVAGAEAILAQTVAYVKERKAFGKPVAAFQNSQFKLAEMDGAHRDAGIHRPLHRAAPAGQARRAHGRQEQAAVHGPAVQDHRRVRAAARRLRLHVGVSGGARVGRCPRAAHLRRHQRSDEGDHLARVAGMSSCVGPDLSGQLSG